MWKNKEKKLVEKKIPEYIKKTRKIRKRKSYYKWKLFYEFLETNPNKAEIINKVWEILNDSRAFRSRANSIYSLESFHLLFQDKNFCKECKLLIKCKLVGGM